MTCDFCESRESTAELDWLESGYHTRHGDPISVKINFTYWKDKPGPKRTLCADCQIKTLKKAIKKLEATA